MARRDNENFMERIMKQVIKALVFLLVFVVLLALVILPLLKEKFGGILGDTSSSKVAVSDMEVISTLGEEMGYNTTIRATALNNADNEVENVVITFTLFDASDEEIGTAIAELHNLSPGKAVEFYANPIGIIEKEPHSCKVSNILIK